LKEQIKQLYAPKEGELMKFDVIEERSIENSPVGKTPSPFPHFMQFQSPHTQREESGNLHFA
jgi:hypothetical protein